MGNSKRKKEWERSTKKYKKTKRKDKWKRRREKNHKYQQRIK